MLVLLQQARPAQLLALLLMAAWYCEPRAQQGRAVSWHTQGTAVGPPPGGILCSLVACRLLKLVHCRPCAAAPAANTP